MEPVEETEPRRYGTEPFKTIEEYDRKTDRWKVLGYYINEDSRFTYEKGMRYENHKGKWVVYKFLPGTGRYGDDDSWIDDVLYIGQTSDFNNRLAGHRNSKAWFGEVKEIKFQVFDSEKEALIAEALAIHKENPKYNGTRVKHLPFSDCQIFFVPSSDDDCACWNVDGYRPYRNYSTWHLEDILQRQWEDASMNRTIVLELLERLKEHEGSERPKQYVRQPWLIK